MRSLTPLCVTLLFPVASLAAQQPTRPDTLTGRLTTDSAVALPDAEIIVTRGPDRTVFRTRTDTDGRWRIIADPGTGDYLVYATAPGRTPLRKRVTRSAANETHFTVDLSLAAAAVTTLARVEVKAAKRERVDRPGDMETPRGNAELVSDGVVGSVPPLRAGDPAAIAATMPGFRPGAGGISALGLPGSQTLTTLNGLGFAGGELPRGVATSVRAATTAWDVERGGFSGAQVDISLSPGWTYGQTTLTVTGDAPALQATDAAGRALGQRSTRLDVNLAKQGALSRDDRFTYSMGGRVRRSSAPVPSALTATREAFAASGVSADTVARFLEALRVFGIAPGTGDGTTTTDVQFAGRLDRAPYDPLTYDAVPRTFGLVALLNGTANDGVGMRALGTQSATASGRDVTAALQAQHSYSGKTWLHETRTSLSLRDARTTPRSLVPAGSVRVTGTQASDGGITTLDFGGNGFLANEARQLVWEVTHASQVYATPGTRHRVKLFAQGRVDRGESRAITNAQGSYSYMSIDDLLLRTPANFTRTLREPSRTGTTFNGALGIGSVYRTSQFFSMQYGVRLEANRFLGAPVENGVLRQSLGVRTSTAPTILAASPRLGFRLVYRRKRQDFGGMTVAPYGTQISEPSGVLSGGIGEFRNFITTDAIAGPVAATGLAGSTLRLACLGTAVPAPEWDAYDATPSSVPAACAGGAPSLADRTPGVRALARDYEPPRSWRANLTWAGQVARTSVTIAGVASLNRAQSSSIDANFAGLSRFTLAAEGGRPVFVPAADIVPASGATSPVRGRRDSTFGSVLVSGASARSTSTQLRVTLAPTFRIPRIPQLRASWVRGTMRATGNGFDLNTGADPRVFERAAGDEDVRHQVQVSSALALGKGFYLTTFLNATSGLPFTPLVRGDINGDGISGNDRAFVTRGAQQPAAFGTTMASLLSAVPSRVQGCLLRAMERIAPRNDCRGPWIAQLSTQLVLPGDLLRLPNNSTVGLYLDNPLAGIDRLLHGNALRGWGAAAIPDPVLYSVRGFDAAGTRFLYDVNPRFGRTDPRLSTLRAPFRVTLEVRANLGAPMSQQQLTRSMRNGRNGDTRPRRTIEQIRKQYAPSVPDIYRPILEERDSLLVTERQVTLLTAAQARQRASADSVWTELATYLDALPDRYDAKAALARQEAAIDAVWDIARQHALALDTILTPQQLTLLSWPASGLRELDPKKKVPFRMFFN